MLNYGIIMEMKNLGERKLEKKKEKRTEQFSSTVIDLRIAQMNLTKR